MFHKKKRGNDNTDPSDLNLRVSRNTSITLEGLQVHESCQPGTYLICLDCLFVFKTQDLLYASR